MYFIVLYCYLKITLGDKMINEVAKILRVTDFKKLFGIGRHTIYRWEREGTFPKRVKLGNKLYGWQEQEVLKWLQDCNR
jgi:prophage regulatory protein